MRNDLSCFFCALSDIEYFKKRSGFINDESTIHYMRLPPVMLLIKRRFAWLKKGYFKSIVYGTLQSDNASDLYGFFEVLGFYKFK